MHVPRMFGLGDLAQFLDERAYTQACECLGGIRIRDDDRRSGCWLNKYLKLGE